MPALSPLSTSPLLQDALAAAPPALTRLRAAAADLLPLPALDGEAYALGHAAFEQRSTQRSLLTRWLGDRLARRGGDLEVLSIGCGDGTLDATLARSLAGGAAGVGTRAVRYHGVDPHPASVGRFLEVVGAVAGVVASAAVGRAEQVPASARYDVVLCVHSLYYVQDLGAVLSRLATLLAPGGEVVVALAPRAELNQLAASLAPDLDGHRQWWSDDLADRLVAAGIDAERVTLHGRLALDDCRDPADRTARQVLDFVVQAVLPDALHARVLEHLEAVRLPGPGFAVDHPVDVWVVRAR